MMSAIDPVQTLMFRLRSAGCDPREAGPDAWESQCPFHRGQRRNLSVKRGDDGRALVYCHHTPSCKADDIVKSLGLCLTDLFSHDPASERHHSKGKAKPARRAYPTPDAALSQAFQEYGQPTGYWVYSLADGLEQFRVYRFDYTNPKDGTPGKSYRPVHPTHEGWVIGDPPGPLVLYRLPDMGDAPRVYLTEGEKAADLARGLGVAATASAHGAKAAHKTDWGPLAGREVVILPDHDPEGEIYARTVKALLARLEPRPRVRVVRLPDVWRTSVPISGGADVAEWLTDGIPEVWEGEHCRAELNRAGDAAPVEELDDGPGTETPHVANPLDWPDDPKPIRYELRSVPPLPPEMIPNPLRGWLEDIAERVSCPLDFPAVGAIVALAIVTGRRVAIRPKRQDDWTVVPNLWGAVIGRPGVMKTPALTEATKPLRRLEAEARKRHEAALDMFRADDLVATFQADAAKRELKAAATAKKERSILESLAREAAKGTASAEPTLRRYTTSDPTVEALGNLLRDNPNGVGIVRDELPGWFRGLDKDGRECDRSFYLEAWNGIGTHFDYDRIGRGHILIPNPCVSILGAMQPGPLRSLLRRVASGDESDDGLISRFQLMVWPDTARQWRNVDRWPDTALKNRDFAVYQAIDSLDPSSAGAAPDDDGGPPFHRFDPEAQDVFDPWRYALEYKLLAADETPLIESHLAKYRSLMPSLALLFHLIGVADGDGAGPVTVRSAQLAVEWCAYLESHARRIYGSITEPEIEAAHVLADRIREAALPSPFSLRDVYRRGWSGLTTPDSARRAVMVLEELSWLRTVESRETGGAPREDIHIHPKLPRKAPLIS